MNGLEAFEPIIGMLSLAPIGFLAGLGVFSWYVRAYAGDWAWLQTWSERMRFLAWPLPPRNIVKVIHQDGRVDLFYDAPVRESRNAVVLETPIGFIRLAPPRFTPTGLNVYLPGMASPMHFLTAGLAGVIAEYLVIYYGMVLSGYGPYSLLALLVLGYAWLWYQAAATPNTVLYTAVVTAVASGFLQAVPAPGEGVSPKEFARFVCNRGVKVVVDRDAKRALEETAELIGSDITAAAELLSNASMYTMMRRYVTSMALKAASIASVRRSIGVYTLAELTSRVTLPRVLAWLLFFLVGLAVGYALGGGSIVIAPAPPNATTAGVWGP